MANNPTKKDTTTLDIVRSIDDIVRLSGKGTRSATNFDMTHGLNFSGQNQQLTSPNRQTSGTVFFTRPMLNLTYGNLTRCRRLHPWRDADPRSSLGIARSYLDPRLSDQTVKDLEGQVIPWQNRFQSPLVDPFNPFICLLTNTLMSLSGWQDMRGDTYKSDRGIRNEQWFMYDGIAEINEIYSLDATFRNPEGDATLILFLLWQIYMSEIRNSIDPYPEMIVNRRLDYNTRIYDFVLDQNQQYLLHWAATGASIPMNTPFGKIFDYDYSQTFNHGLDQLNISFESAYADYNDIITLYEFNKVVGMFNPSLRLYNNPYMNQGNAPFKNITDDYQDNIPFMNNGNNKSGNAPWIKLMPSEKLRANYRAYPLINLYTKELEWWVRRADFARYVMGLRFSDDEMRNPSEQLARNIRDYFHDTRK